MTDYREDGMDLASDASSRSGSESNLNSNKVTPCSECKSSPSLELAALDDYDEEDEEFQQYKKRVIEDWENEYDADNQNGQDRTLRKAVNGRSLAEELQEVKSSPATASEEFKQNGNLILPRKPQAKAIPKTPGTGGGGGGGGLGVGGMGLEGCYRLGGYREDTVVEEESQLPTMDWAALERHLAGLQFREQQENHNRNLGRTNSMNFRPSTFCTAYPRQGSLERIPGDSGHKTPWTGCQHIAGHRHTFTHYGQFGTASQPTTHVFGLGEETREPEETPEALGEHAHTAHPQTWGSRLMC